MTPAIHYRPSSSYTEQWFPVHVRQFLVNISHHRTLSVSDDGRVAIASGPFLNVLHPPPVPPFRPAPKPHLRLVYSVEAHAETSSKDSAIADSQLTSVVWAADALLLLDGTSTLIVLRFPDSLDANNISPDLTSDLWRPSPLISSSSSNNSYQRSSEKKNVRCFAFTRLPYTVDDDSDHRLIFFPVVAYGTDESAELCPYSFDGKADKACLISIPTRIHSVCTTAIACVDGVKTKSDLVTAVALSDAMQNIIVYTVIVNMNSDGPTLTFEKVWMSESNVPLGPVASLSWCLHSERSSFLSLAIAKGNDVIVADWGFAACTALSKTEWGSPRIVCIRDAHDHVVTSAHVCYDGSMVSAGMDGRVIRWRIYSQQDDISNVDREISAAIVHEYGENNEPVMALERTANGFAIATLASTVSNNQENCDDFSVRKNSNLVRRAAFQLLLCPPYGSVDDIESSILSCARRLMNHPSLLDQPITTWDASHFLHTFVDVSTSVVPRLREQLAEMAEIHEKKYESSSQLFVQRCRVILWLARVLDHPDCPEKDVQGIIKEVCRRIRNSVLLVQYSRCLQNFLELQKKDQHFSQLELLSLEHMCQFVSAWRAEGWAQSQASLQVVRDVRIWLEPFLANGENLTSTCTVCSCSSIETPLLADAMDPSTVWCTAGHTFSRCVSTALPVTDVISLECAGCSSRSVNIPKNTFLWIAGQGHCCICRGGLVGANCEAGYL